MGLKREGVLITNILNWRPEHPMPSGNRKPTPVEMAYCLPFVKAQLQIVQPKVVVALGKTAAEGLLGDRGKASLKKLRQGVHEMELPAGMKVQVMPTYHPSYLLRYSTHATKREAWEDLLEVMELLGLPISDKQRNYFL